MGTLADMEFSPTALVNSRLTVVDWPADADDELVEAVERIAGFATANDAPAVLDAGASAHLAWRGYITGGLVTLYEALGVLLSEHGLGAFYADPRLEVFVPPAGDVVVLGALRHPIAVSRQEWDDHVSSASDGNALAARFIRDALDERASDVVAEARQAAEEDAHPFAAVRPAAIEMTAPGEVDFDLLQDTECELTERYDPEDNLQDAWLTFRVLRWRTDFVAPGTVMPPSERLEDSTGWRVSQWEWLDGDEDERDEEGERWALRTHMPLTPAEVAEWAPDPLRPWVRRMTEEGVRLLTELADEEPVFLDAARRLKAELDALE
jgi:hypothetical protein